MINPRENWLTDDARGIQMPWYTRPCLEVINDWDFKDKNIFEYGVGYSTLWYLSRGASCYGVDSNEKWADITGIQAYIDVYVNIEDYTEAVLYYSDNDDNFDKYAALTPFFDMIIIDGIYRDDCTTHALRLLKTGGKLIMDNWLQPEVEEFWPKTQKLIEGMPIEVYKEPEHPHWKTAIVTV